MQNNNTHAQLHSPVPRSNLNIKGQNPLRESYRKTCVMDCERNNTYR